MKRNFDNLMLLLEGVPSYNMPHYREELSNILREYKSVLELLSQTSTDCNMKTNIYEKEIIAIQNNLSRAKSAKTEFEKDQAFINAIKALKSNIKELSSLIG